MKSRIALSASLALFLGVAVLTAAALSPQHADAFARKVAIISQQGTLAGTAHAVPLGARRSARRSSIRGSRIVRARCCRWA